MPTGKKNILKVIVSRPAILVAFLIPGCLANDAKVDQVGDGKVEIDNSNAAVQVRQLVADMDATIKMIESLKVEMRAGTQEKTDSSTAGRDKTQSESQQQGLFNWSWQEQAAGGLGISALFAMTILLYSSRKQTERIELARAQREAEETKRDIILYAFVCTLLDKKPLPDWVDKSTRVESCGRGRWPWSKCKTGAS